MHAKHLNGVRAYVCVYVHVCVCMCVCVCVYACMRAHVRVCKSSEIHAGCCYIH